MKRIGKYTKKIRERSGLTQLQLSKLMGFSTPQFVSNIERGLVVPSPKFIAALDTIGGELDLVLLIDMISEAQREKLIGKINTERKKVEHGR